MIDDLGPRRAQELNDASRFREWTYRFIQKLQPTEINSRIYLVKAHPAQRQEVFRNFSKSIRGQLEVAKQLSKVRRLRLSGTTRTINLKNLKIQEAEEAEALIQSVKNLSSI